MAPASFRNRQKLHNVLGCSSRARESPRRHRHHRNLDRLGLAKTQRGESPANPMDGHYLSTAPSGDCISVRIDRMTANS